MTKTAETVTNISKLSPTHFFSNIRRQHRCSQKLHFLWKLTDWLWQFDNRVTNCYRASLWGSLFRTQNYGDGCWWLNSAVDKLDVGDRFGAVFLFYFSILFLLPFDVFVNNGWSRDFSRCQIKCFVEDFTAWLDCLCCWCYDCIFCWNDSIIDTFLLQLNTVCCDNLPESDVEIVVP